MEWLGQLTVLFVSIVTAWGSISRKPLLSKMLILITWSCYNLIRRLPSLRASHSFATHFQVYGKLSQRINKKVLITSLVTYTVVGETLVVFWLPQIWKNCQCLDGQVGKTFLEIFGGNDNFLKFREAMNVLFSLIFKYRIHEFLDFFEVFRTKLFYTVSCSHVLPSLDSP